MSFAIDGSYHGYEPADASADACECGETLGKDGFCPECEPCPHDDTDHGICLDCEVDLTADLASAAYDRAKNLRKYGE